MGMEERESSIKKALRSLCLSYGWSYGVFWGFDLRNNMLLTLEDAYYEEEASNVVDNMLLQVHMLGEGKIGEAAFDGKYRWMFLDDMKEQVPSGDDSEFSLQFSSQIKTVAVIPLELRGVLEFGSTKEISETPEFLEQARKFLLDGGNFVGSDLAGNASSSLNSDLTNQAELFASSNVSMSWENMVENIGDCWTFDSLPFPGGAFDEKTGDDFGTGELIVDPNFGSLLVNDGICDDRSSNVMNTFEEQLASSHCPSPLFDPSQMDDLSRWLDDASSLFPTGMEAIVSEDISQAMDRNDMFLSSQGRQTASSPPSSLSYALDSCGKGKSLNAPLNKGGLLAELGIDVEYEKLGECLETIMNPIEDNFNSLPIHSHRSMTESISGIQGGNSSIGAPQKGLFSELGLEHLLRDISSSSSITKSSIEDPWDPSKRRKTETYQTMYNQKCQLTRHPNWEVNSGSLKECMPKSRVGVKVENSYSMDAKSCISSVNEQKKKTEEPIKATKKRARPGESTKPRPKDRQMIADRIKELRDLIPNGSKLSIDALLGRTVKHILFKQSLKKHAEKLKLVNEPKLIGQENGLVNKGSSASISSGRGATWAYEVGGSNLFCPIIVEDLSYPGQMLIEMLCEEQGYFLEIIDVVRSFGLTILKGVMESRDDKIWAHFIVEGNKHITRMDVFMSLMQLLQRTSSDEELTKRSKSGTSEVVSTKGALVLPQWSNYQQYHQHMVPLPI